MGFPDYEVSELGDVRRARPNRVGRYVGVVLRQVAKKDGYREVKLYRDDFTWSTQRVHRVVANAFLGEPVGDRDHVAHGDGNRSNNDYRNLRWATPKENLHDRVRHKTLAAGERHGFAKLTEDNVREIRSMAATRQKGDIVRWAQRFGVTPSVLSNVIANRIWRHVA